MRSLSFQFCMKLEPPNLMRGVSVLVSPCIDATELGRVVGLIPHVPLRISSKTPFFIMSRCCKPRRLEN